MKDQAELAYKKIRDRLLSGWYLPGQRLTERQLSEEFAVNRGDIRQALSRLMAESLVNRGGKGGFFAQEYHETYVLETLEVRYALESAALTLASMRATEEDYRELEEVVQHMALMARHGYALGVYEADLKFHQTLVKAAHNDRLSAVYSHANIPLTGVNALRHVRLEPSAGFSKDASEHAKLVQSLREGRLDEAVKILASSYHWKM